MSLEFFQYGFMVRGLVAGLMIAATVPLIGVFLVLKRYSLIADTLSHVYLAAAAIGLLVGWPPAVTALGATLGASFGLEALRRRRVFSDAALSIVLSGSLALAVVIFSLARGFNANLLSYLFGSLLTVSSRDIALIAVLALVILTALTLFFWELVAVSFDEEAARISGLPVKLINNAFMILAALTVTLAIPVVGALLIAALVVIPSVAALQLRVNLRQTIIFAEAFSLLSVLVGTLLSFYLNLAAGGAIVLTMLFFLSLTALFRPAKNEV